MKKFAVNLIIALAVCALTSSAALAKVKSKTITVGMDFVVGETLVKKGTYKFSFDDKTNELSIIAKDKTVVAKVAARIEKRQQEAAGMDLVLAQKGDQQALVSIAFYRETDNIVVNNGAQMAESGDKAGSSQTNTNN
ncbi:MAG TPA: hypothetical protein VJ715_15420 [Pyrinomonadaceae bacterium]|nr:hypothetical protein [Pyrinomonadaceae bacterium]